MKPFKPLTLSNRSNVITAKENSTPIEPPAKKRRISKESDKVSSVETKSTADKDRDDKHLTSQTNNYRTPLHQVTNCVPAGRQDSLSDHPSSAYYLVLWRKPTNKKHKTWDGDGILVVTDTTAKLHDETGRIIGRGVCKDPLDVGSGLSLGSNVVEVDAVITRDEYLAKIHRDGAPKKVPASVKDEPRTGPRQAKLSKPVTALPTIKDRLVMKTPDAATIDGPGGGFAAFKAPMLTGSTVMSTKNSKTPAPRHDPKAEGALVMKRPDDPPKNKQIVDVVVDPQLSQKLREHQREGVRFLYECVMNMREHVGEGAILADEMGLGKTLQTITLLWTLLKQNPVYGDPPVVQKALIVCPVTLINNWRAEFRKWLGLNQIHVFVDDAKKSRLTDFTLGKVYNVMIIGYEKLTKVQEQLQKCKLDIVILDEGHRLKTEKNKAALAIKSFNTARRVILSGTPMQNDLAEFYTLVDLVNPGLLGKYNSFKKNFETPILKGRQPGAAKKDVQNGEDCSRELAEITKGFILRRTADILTGYLPPKTEHVVFCTPTSAQINVYRTIIDSPAYSEALGSSALALELINILRKLCNSPSLLLSKDEKEQNPIKSILSEIMPPGTIQPAPSGGKLDVLKALLHHIRTTTEEKVVIVSNFTSTLDMLESALAAQSYPCLRLDGSTPHAKRLDLVTRFNRTPASDTFLFLLSARAGGTGLNLIGASRLVLYDADWNPAVDAQAMARVHRDGQRRPVHLYRLLLARGALDEKIFQRQLAKTGLADAVVDRRADAPSASHFSRAELRDLFSLMPDETGPDAKARSAGLCQTHALLRCGCAALGLPSGIVSDVDAEAVAEEVNESDGSEREPSPPPPSSSFRRGVSQQSIDEEDAERARRTDEEGAGRRDRLLSLMQYTHFDPGNADVMVDAGRMEDDGRVEGGVEEVGEETEVERVCALDYAIEDESLRAVIRRISKRVAFVLTKSSALQAK